MLKPNGKLGRKIDEMKIGERLHITETIEDKDLLLYLGLTNDSNPLYIQHDYAADTPFGKPIVPTIMLNGIITSAISKHIPGPGSNILEQHLVYSQPVFHYETIEFTLQMDLIDEEKNMVEISVRGYNAQKQSIVEGVIKVSPPY
ncbi:MAG: MaoC/PaaZ C-terminal domain-containing protein [Solibacillus sp.]